MRKILLAALAMPAVLIFCSSGLAAIKTADVPTFKLRARVIAAPGDKPGKLPPRHTFHLGKATATADDGQWTDLMEFWLPEAQAALKSYPNLYMHAFPIVTHLQVDRATDPTPVEVELTFDENKQTVAMRAELFGPTLGILIWRDADKKPMSGTMADYNRLTYWKAIEGTAIPVERRPKKFPIVDRFIAGDDDRADWREGLHALAGAGYSAIMVPPSKPVRAMLLEAGVTRTAWAVYSPPGYTFPDAAPGAKAEPMALDAWADKEAKQYLDAGFALKDIAWFGMSDEPGWYYPSCFRFVEKPAAQERFHAYLTAQGLQPADVGAVKWDDVKPLGRSGAKDLPSKRLFYWTARFFAYDSSRYFADSTAALEKAFYPGLPIATNFNFFAGRFFVPGPVANNPDKKNPDAAMGGHDWLEFGRLRGSTMLWTEDWFGDVGAPQWSFYCAKLRSAAEKSRVNFGGYVVPRASGDLEDGLLQKILCVIGSGGKAINTFTFGPEYNFPGNCYSQRPQLLARLADAFGTVGAAEDLLWEGKRPRPRVAILSPRSAEVWDAKDEPIAHGYSDATNTNLNGATVDYLAEEADLYLALQHANIPTDFVEEDDLSPRGLAAYRVLYVTEPNIPEEYQRGLAEWVRAGGTLVTVSGAGAADRYDEPCHVLADMEGVNEQPRARVPILRFTDLKPAGTIKWTHGGATLIGPRGTLVKPQGDILATFDDESPAVVHRAVGKGRVVHFAWMPGLSYFATGKHKKGKLAGGFSPELREWICAPVGQGGVVAPVTTDFPLVETPILLSDHGAAITILNWTGEAIPKLTLQVRVPFDVKSATAVRAGAPVQMAKRNGEVWITLPVAGADVLLLRP